MQSFDKNHRDSILAALKQPRSNPIASAVAEGIRRFTINLAAMADKNGAWPTELLLKRPQTEFDSIVIQLTLQHVANELDHQIDILWVP